MEILRKPKSLFSGESGRELEEGLPKAIEILERTKKNYTVKIEQKIDEQSDELDKKTCIRGKGSTRFTAAACKGSG